MNKIALALLTSFICGFTLISDNMAAEGFSSVEEQMSGKEFTAAGLDKLSDSELAALNEWIRRRSLATLDAPAGAYAPAAAIGVEEDERGFEVRDMQMEREPITARIKGSFTGWDGNMIFELDNGMIWEQADKDKFYIKEVKDPVVVIEPGAFRTWRLHVEGYSSECRVERIQ